jgi:CIC family chloride channel protein
MSDPPAVIELNEQMKAVMKKFDETNSWNLPVISNGKFIGMLSKSAILSVYREELLQQS